MLLLHAGQSPVPARGGSVGWTWLVAMVKKLEAAKRGYMGDHVMYLGDAGYGLSRLIDGKREYCTFI